VDKHFVVIPLVWNLSEKRSKQTDVIGVVNIGFFLLLLGVILAVTPNLSDRIYDFVNNFEIREITPNVYFPAPKSDHPVLYIAIFQFCLVFAIFQVFVLGARFILKDPINKKAGTFSSIIFWIGASWIVSLLIAKTIEWFVFLGGLITLIGISIVISNAIVLVTQLYRRT